LLGECCWVRPARESIPGADAAAVGDDARLDA
jgi:hypothetical protein